MAGMSSEIFGNVIISQKLIMQIVSEEKQQRCAQKMVC
jgi:hypothetical protein